MATGKEFALRPDLPCDLSHNLRAIMNAPNIKVERIQQSIKELPILYSIWAFSAQREYTLGGGDTQRDMQCILWQAPKFHLGCVQHVACLHNEPVSNFFIYWHLLESKTFIVHIVASPGHDGMDMVTILVVPV